MKDSVIDLADGIRFKAWVLMDQTRHAMDKSREKELRQYNMTPAQAAALYIIDTSGRKTTPSTISQWHLRETSSMSGLLARMEKEGLILRTRDLRRKNQVRISITRKGRRAYRKSLARESIKNIMSCLSDEECQQFTSLLLKLRDKALQEIGVRRIPPLPLDNF